MSRVKQSVMEAILVSNNPWNVEQIAKRSGHTIEITRKWIKVFLENELVEAVETKPFKGMMNDEVRRLDLISFFKKYRRCE